MNTATKYFYIPLDIGDWVKDTSCVGMELQGCLLNLIFKLWDSEDKGRVTISFSQLSLMWKKPIEDCRKIVSEIAENDLLNVEILPENKVKFESRRMLRKVAKSLTASKNGSKGGRPKKAKGKQTESKLKAKPKLNAINDYGYVSDFVSKLIPTTWPQKEFVEIWIEFEKIRKGKNKLTDHARKLNIADLVKIAGDDWDKAKQSIETTIKKGWSGFFQPDERQSSINGNKSKTPIADTYANR